VTICCGKPPSTTARSPKNRLARVLLSGTGHGGGQGRGPLEMATWWRRKAPAKRRPPALDEALASLSPAGSRRGRGRRAAKMARRQMIRLDATATAGHRTPSPKFISLTLKAELMLHSALINVNGQSPRAAARPQASRRDPRRDRKSSGIAEGPRPISSPWRPPRRGDALCGPLQGAAGVTASSARKAEKREGADKSHTWIVDPLDGNHQLSCTASRNLRFSIGLQRGGHADRRRDLQPGQRRNSTRAERGKGRPSSTTNALRVAGRAQAFNECVIACGLPAYRAPADPRSFTRRADRDSSPASPVFPSVWRGHRSISLSSAGRPPSTAIGSGNLQPWDLGGQAKSSVREGRRPSSAASKAMTTRLKTGRRDLRQMNSFTPRLVEDSQARLGSDGASCPERAASELGAPSYAGALPARPLATASRISRHALEACRFTANRFFGARVSLGTEHAQSSSWKASLSLFASFSNPTVAF